MSGGDKVYMRIMFVSNISWSLFNFRKGIMAELKNRGHRVISCATPDGYSAKLREKGFEFIPINVDRKGTNILRDMSLIARLYSIYRKEKPDLVFHNSHKPNIYGSIAARLAGVKCVNTVSGLGYVFIRKSMHFIPMKILYTMACAFSEKTFFHNKDDLALFVEKKIINPKKAILVKGSGVDTEFFNPEYCKTAKKNNGVFVFSFIGRVLWDKGIGDFIEAARIIKQKYPSSKFNILGMIDSGNPAAVTRPEIKDWQREGVAEYLGEFSDVRPFICASDCVVLPSYREGTPKSLLEVSAMERLVITTDAVGCREVVDDGITGFLVPIKDFRKLAEVMQKVIEMFPEKRIAMGRAGREKVLREFNEKEVIECYLTEFGL